MLDKEMRTPRTTEAEKTGVAKEKLEPTEAIQTRRDIADSREREKRKGG